MPLRNSMAGVCAQEMFSQGPINITDGPVCAARITSLFFLGDDAYIIKDGSHRIQHILGYLTSRMHWIAQSRPPGF